MDLSVDDLALKAFKESGFPEIDVHFPAPSDRAALLKRRSDVALRYSLAIAPLSAAVTFAGLVAALWHTASWIGTILLVMTVLSAGLILVVFADAQPPDSA